MGIINFFKAPKTEEEQVFDQIQDRLFPGGDAERLFKAKKVVEISNGKLDLPHAIRVYTTAKARIWIACTGFDGESKVGIKAEVMLERTKNDSQNKLSTIEAASVIYYSIYDKVDLEIDSSLKVKKWADMMFGVDDRGTDSDEIFQALGEFGLDATNPVPVRGILSNPIYLGRLRTNDGRKIEYKRAGSLEVPTIDGNVDEYNIIQDGRLTCKLYICPYHRKISARPPAGFLLVKQDL